MSGIKVSWHSPVAAVGGKHFNKIIKATGVETVGELLGIYPRRYVRKGSLSELEELNEGDLLSLVGGSVTARLSWGQVFGRPCWTTGQVARLLTERGWTGSPQPCGPECPLRG